MINIDLNLSLKQKKRFVNLVNGQSFELLKSSGEDFLEYLCSLTLPAGFNRRGISWRICMDVVHQNFGGHGDD